MAPALRIIVGIVARSGKGRYGWEVEARCGRFGLGLAGDLEGFRRCRGCAFRCRGLRLLWAVRVDDVVGERTELRFRLGLRCGRRGMRIRRGAR
jgi:hypothetical protein